MTENIKFGYPVFDESYPHNGVQYLYKFPNGYGASVIQHSFSYGHEDGLWELAVIKWNDQGKFNITYDTPITDDVLGYLDDESVEETLSEIKELE